MSLSRRTQKSLVLGSHGTIAAALAMGVVAGQSRALGQALNWTNAAGGTASTAANWNPAQIPGAGNPLQFQLNSAYPVTFNATTPSSASMTFTRGTPTLTMSSPHTTGNVSFGVSGTTGAAILTTGALTAAAVTLGPVSNSAGSLSVNSSDATLDCGQLLVAGNTSLTCSVSVTGGGRITPAQVVVAQIDTSGAGSITVSGQTLAPIQRSTIDCSGLTAIGLRGVGTLTVSAGALYNTDGGMDIGTLSTAGVPSTGTVTVGGAGIIFPATLTVGTNVRIGRGSLSTSDAGNGTLSVNGGGSVSIAGTTTVGGSGLGSGILQVSGGQLTTHGLSFGTSGDFQHTGGTVTVTHGGFTHDEATLIVSGASPGPTLELDAVTNQITFAAASSTADAMLIGNSGVGSLALTGGSDVSVTLGKVRIGNGANSSGTLAVDAASSLTVAASGDIIVGDEGTGTFTARGGAHIVAGGVIVSQSTGAGTVLFENPGTAVTVDAVNFNAGATATIRDGAVLTTNGSFGNQVPVQSGASLTLENATIDATTDVQIGAGSTFTMNNGTINADHFTFAQPISASGTINAKVVGNHLITATGDLNLGAANTQGFSGAPLAVNGFRVELRDINVAVLGNTTISGGQLVATDRFSLNPGATLSGTGTISGDFSNTGLITATGAFGLTFNGILSGVGQGIGGTQINFGPTGGYTGAGSINARVTSQPGSIIQTIGNCTLGDGSNNGVSLDGELRCGGNIVFLSDSSGARLGGLTTIDHGRIESTTSITVLVDGRLLGDGLVQTTLNSVGAIEPGVPGDTLAGLLNVNGTYTGIANSSVLRVEILSATQADRLQVTDVANIGGGLNVAYRPPFHPTAPATYTILSANGGVIGTFAPPFTSLPRGCRLRYTPTTVLLVSCPADFNSSGAITVQDIFDFLTAWFASNPAADFNGSGTITVQDIFDFLSAWFAGC